MTIKYCDKKRNLYNFVASSKLYETLVNVVQTKVFVVRTKKGKVVDLNLIGESLFKGARPR